MDATRVTGMDGLMLTTDGIFQFMGEIVLFGSLLGDPIPLDGHVLQVFAGAQGLIKLWRAIVELLGDRERTVDTLAGGKSVGWTAGNS